MGPVTWGDWAEREVQGWEGEEARLLQTQSDRLVPGADRREERDKGQDNFGGERRAVGRVCGQVTGSSQRKIFNLRFGTEIFLKAILLIKPF